MLYNDPDPDTGFLILPDLKWDQKQLENLYLTGLARKGIWSMRELTGEHLPLLKKMVCKGKVSDVIVLLNVVHFHLCALSVLQGKLLLIVHFQ